MLSVRFTIFSHVVISKTLVQFAIFLTKLNKVFIYGSFIQFIFILPQHLNTTILHNKALTRVKAKC